MITVEIKINGALLYARSARNTGSKNNDGETIYFCDEGSMINHKREDGAVVLARKMLDTIEEI
jgi:hypothetical protein